MNNENNNFNNGQNVNNTPINDKFMPVSDINQINQPVNNTVPSTQPVTYQQVVEPTTQPEVISEPVTEPIKDNNAMINENLHKVEIKDYTPPSKFKLFLLFLFFCLLIVFIIFLPQISTFIRNYGKETDYQKPTEVITTGKLICTLTGNTSDLDKEYEFNFNFTESKLKRTKYIVYTRGDTTTEALLDELNEKCKVLKNDTSEIEGVSIKCDYTEGKLTETQIFELETIDTEKLTAAFAEAGGVLPSYTYDQDIDSIETNMKASGYTCERQK